eukprot:INCI4105.2.p1 GENE.INCI4105.2~~INCI4105.2.p1  ORF type:complete len:878 (+),score=169.36 INCI4105.2:226-2859(+)
MRSSSSSALEGALAANRALQNALAEQLARLEIAEAETQAAYARELSLGPSAPPRLETASRRQSASSSDASSTTTTTTTTATATTTTTTTTTTFATPGSEQQQRAQGDGAASASASASAAVPARALAAAAAAAAPAAASPASLFAYPRKFSGFRSHRSQFVRGLFCDAGKRDRFGPFWAVSAKQGLVRGPALTPSQFAPKQWTKAEDNALRAAVRVLIPRDERRNLQFWKRLDLDKVPIPTVPSTAVDGPNMSSASRTAAAIQAAAKRRRAAETIRAAVKNFAMLTARMGGRADCYLRWHSVVDPTLSLRSWVPREDALLLREAVKHRGREWDKIAAALNTIAKTNLRNRSRDDGSWTALKDQEGGSDPTNGRGLRRSTAVRRSPWQCIRRFKLLQRRLVLRSGDSARSNHESSARVSSRRASQPKKSETCVGSGDESVRSPRAATIAAATAEGLFALDGAQQRWSADEDSLLMKAVRRFGERDWFIVAMQIPSRTGKQCANRWQKLKQAAPSQHWPQHEQLNSTEKESVESSLNSSQEESVPLARRDVSDSNASPQWSLEAEVRLYLAHFATTAAGDFVATRRTAHTKPGNARSQTADAFSKGARWEAIAALVGTGKSAAQCSKHCRLLLQNTDDDLAWTKALDDQLLELVRPYNNAADIAQLTGDGDLAMKTFTTTALDLPAAQHNRRSSEKAGPASVVAAVAVAATDNESQIPAALRVQPKRKIPWQTIGAQLCRPPNQCRTQWRKLVRAKGKEFRVKKKKEQQAKKRREATAKKKRKVQQAKRRVTARAKRTKVKCSKASPQRTATSANAKRTPATASSQSRRTPTAATASAKSTSGSVATAKSTRNTPKTMGTATSTTPGHRRSARQATKHTP